MKAKDLMMSDFYWWEAEGKKYSLQVTKDTFKLEDEDIANFEPIPITEEFLEKNGFLKTKIHGIIYYSIKNELDYWSWEPCNGGIYQMFFGDEEELDAFYTGIDIKYVHELQHALRLVGLSETADNLKLNK